MLLTDKEIQKLDTSRFWFKHTPHEFARVIEAAVLAKLASEQEPAAWWDEEGVRLRYSDTFDIPRGTPLYFHPAPTQEPLIAAAPDLLAELEAQLARDRQPLTVEVIADIAMQSGAYDEQLLAFARAIEAAHGIKEKP